MADQRRLRRAAFLPDLLDQNADQRIGGAGHGHAEPVEEAVLGDGDRVLRQLLEAQAGGIGGEALRGVVRRLELVQCAFHGILPYYARWLSPSLTPAHWIAERDRKRVVWGRSL